MIQLLVEAVESLLKPSTSALLFDLYCGVGLFGISLASRYGHVIGIEESSESIKFARQNAKTNGVTNVTFVSSKVENAHSLDEMLRVAGNFSITRSMKMHLIVDPPRRGLSERAIDLLLSLAEGTGELSRIDRLVYVSCNPITLVNDLLKLSEKYSVCKVQPLDFFPQTKHVETAVLLEPRVSR